ncbi:autotransporter outer membrane beta-barrel domain-containing protein [Acidaminococcus massiliensis]|uniref:autotransporter outer membrane beta-barrel domain-containing protein n=1 Tax=Acidaminococcus massiliensis TaxID=1852375 RepID=UPI0026DD23DA|nr:autotransporter outer membrane beta-barrel domain-containing protein [Acidaminococcus massiliensis]
MKKQLPRPTTLGLTAAVLLSLLSWQGKAQADARTYEYVNKWSGDATEGDPITVKYLQGWNQDQVTVGKDSTRQVTIEDYGGGNGGDATVLGKNISFTGGFTTGGTIHAGSVDTENLSAVTVNAVQLGGQSAGGTVDLDGKNLSVTGSQGVNAAGGSTLSLGTRYMTGNLHIQTLSVSGSSTVTIGNANAGDITIDEFGVGGTQTPSTGEPILNTITVSGNNLSIGNTRASESNAQVTFNARGNVTAKNGLVMTGSYLPSSAPYASITVNAGGDVELGTYGQTSSPWNRNAALAAVGGHAKIAVTAAGKVDASGDFTVTGDGSIRVKAASISSDGLLHATGKDASLTLIAEDPAGNRGDITAQELQVDSQGTASLTGKTITLAPEADGSYFHRSLHVTDCDVDMDADEINLASGILFNGTAKLDLKAARKLTIGNALNENSYDTSAIRLTYGGYGEAGTGQLYAGGSQAEVTVNGSVAVTGTSNQDELAWFNGKDLVFNASRKPALTDTSSDMYNAVALDFTDSQFWSGNVDTTETTTVNGHILTNGSNAFVLYGSQAVTLNGLKGDFENNRNAFSLTDRGSSSIQIGDADTAQTTVNGEIVTGKDTILYVGGKNILLDNAGYTALYANANSKSVEIGRTAPAGSTSDTVAIKGRLLVNGVARMDVVGKNITLSDGAAPDSGTLGTTVKTKEDETSTDPDSHTHDAVVIQQAADNALVIGEADSNVSIDGRLVGLNGGYSVDGDTIHIYEGSNKNQNLILTTGGAVNLGHDGTRLLQIDGGIWALGDSVNKVALEGKDILIDPASGMRAVQANAMPVTIGGSATENAVVKGEIWSLSEKAPITLDANLYVLSANGSTYAARSSGGGSITLGHEGSTGVIEGDLTAAAGSSLEAYLKGSGSQLKGKVEDQNLDSGIAPDAGITLHLNDGAIWNLDGDSKVTSLQADKGIIHLNQDTIDQSLYTGNFAGDGAVVLMGHQGNAQVNDRLYVKGAHTGTTQLQLHAVKGKWTDGAIGSVLVSVGEEQGKFYVPDQEDRLFFHRVLLDTHEKSKGDAVTQGYNTDWYLKGFQNLTTDDKGHHTHFVQSMMGLQGMNYQMWREDTDSLFKRMGDLHTQDAAPEGVWARAAGTRSQRSGEEGAFTLQHHQYQVGYDKLLGENGKERHYQGIGLGYSRGTGTFYGGTSDLTGISLGLYDTHVKKDGQYWDFVLKGQHLSDEVYGSYGAKGTLDNNGFTAGAEYGWKKHFSGGWFLEPQAQFTLGWLKGASADLANGVHYEENNIHSAVGRAGFRAGYEDHRAQFFVKADWFHEFGGSGEIRFADDEGFLKLDRDYGDNWFEYGFGMAVQLSPQSQFYLEGEKSSTGTYRKNWSWDAGVRWKF